MLQVSNHTDSSNTNDMPISLRLCFTQRTSLYLFSPKKKQNQLHLKPRLFFLRGFE